MKKTETVMLSHVPETVCHVEPCHREGKKKNNTETVMLAMSQRAGEKRL